MKLKQRHITANNLHHKVTLFRFSFVALDNHSDGNKIHLSYVVIVGIDS